jgi:hypothetical protein
MILNNPIRTLHWTILFLIGIGFTSNAQILNDSTKKVYGYHSLRYGTEEDVFLNIGLHREIDSNLVNIQRYGYIYKKGQYSQDLGNWATPIKCITSYMPTQLGVQTGFTAYDAYEFKAEDVKYFDTKSPYAELKYYQGSRGQQSLDASFSRNINAQWNIGMDLRRIVSKKIIGFVQANDKQAENYSFDLYASHHSKNNRYFLLATFNYLEAHTFETGGIQPDTLNGVRNDKNNLFKYQLEKVWLTYNSSRSLDKRYNYRLYQHYSILPKNTLQVFYRFDYSYRVNRYDDNALASNMRFYKQYTDYDPYGRFSFQQITDRTNFNLFDNRAGVKGTTHNFFYSAYLKDRYVTSYQPSLFSTFDPFETKSNQWYTGGQLRKYMDSSQLSYLEVKGEYQIMNSVKSADNNYMLAVNGAYKGFSLEASTWNVSPTMLQSSYRSNLTSWDNSFKLQNTKRVFLQYAYKKKRIDMIPSISVSSYKNYIYFTQAGTPAQFNDSIIHIQPKLALRFNLWKIHIYNEFQYNDVSNGSQYLQMPRYVNSTQLFVEAWLFKHATLLQTGFDVLYRSSYQANGYNPMIQQFYVTQYTGTGVAKTDPYNYNYANQYAVVDFFVNMQIRTARLFFKVSNIGGLFGKGYYSTPYYTGIPWTIDFGVNWRFFD